MTRITDISDLNEAKVLLRRAVNVLRPFAAMAGELFARNYNDSESVLHLTSSESGEHILTFKDFRAARDLLKELEADPVGRE